MASLLATPVFAQQPVGTPRMLDAFDDPSTWRVVTSNQVSGKLRVAKGVDGKALCLDYDFNGVSGYVGIQRDLAIDYPENYAFSFRLRGDSPANDLQMKFVDGSGDNVWWVNRPSYDFPRQWTDVRYKKRHIDKAWGPSPDRVLRHSAKLEFTIYNHVGGKGSVCFDALRLQQLAKEDNSPLTATATATQGDASAAVDGDPKTAAEETILLRISHAGLREIFSVKRLVLSLRRHLAPERDVFSVLTNRPTTLLTPDAQVYFRDIYDHVLRINDSLETYRELLSNTLDSYLTQVSNRLGTVTKALSVVATVSLPFVVVSGMWGMNFDEIPLAHTSHGFWTMLVVQLGLGGLLLALLRWRKLL